VTVLIVRVGMLNSINLIYGLHTVTVLFSDRDCL